jgi:hypothetical protein
MCLFASPPVSPAYLLRGGRKGGHVTARRGFRHGEGNALLTAHAGDRHAGLHLGGGKVGDGGEADAEAAREAPHDATRGTTRELVEGDERVEAVVLLRALRGARDVVLGPPNDGRQEAHLRRLGVHLERDLVGPLPVIHC